VDHGKTTLLDKIRGSAIAEKEAGLITQHIGATEVPLEVIKKLCGNLMRGSFIVPGLLFIDTPGHHAFTTLRSRGGALSDLAVLVVDIMEGFQPQTIEAINILRRFRTPFVVAVNKIDRIQGWRPNYNEPFVISYSKQSERVKLALEDKIYFIISQLLNAGFSSDRYDRIRDFQKNVGIIPISAKTGEGIADLLLVLIGLAQRFLEKDLKYDAASAGVGTILEVKEELGLGVTLDVILYDGEIKVGDTIALLGMKEPIITKVRALLKPRPLSEIRAEEKFLRVQRVAAAAGIKIAAPNLEKALAGSPLRVIKDRDKIDEVIQEMKSEIVDVRIDTDQIGVIIKADTLGSLEAIVNELKAKIPIRRADVGDISKRDVVDAATVKDPLYATILGFNVNILPDAMEEVAKAKIQIFQSDVIYKLLEDYEKWVEEQKAAMEKKRLEAIIRPGKIKILPDCVFRASKPAIVGVEVLGGRIRPGVDLIKENGTKIGTLKSIQNKGENIPEAIYHQEVAISIEGPTVGRQIHEGDILHVDLPEKHAKILEQELYDILPRDELETLQAFLAMKRKTNPFWGK
jgi:translation initiation factor 5B